MSCRLTLKSLHSRLFTSFKRSYGVHKGKLKEAEKILKQHGVLQKSDSQIVHLGGHRSYVLLGDAAKLERVLLSWTLNRLVNEFNFTPVVVPTLIYDDMVAACGFDPHGKRTQVFSVDGLQGSSKSTNKEPGLRQVCLAGTAEIPLMGLHRGKTFDVDSDDPSEHLPKRYAAISRCYRAETGNAEKGIYRLHYFSKVEMVSLVRPEDSEATLREFVSIQERLFSDLGLEFKTIDMPKEELGPAAVRKFDIEAMSPVRGTFGEISSASNCWSNQSKRLNIRYRRLRRDNEKKKDNEEDDDPDSPFIEGYVHSVNGTACASPRILLPLVEQHQTLDRKIVIPKVLKDRMNGQEYLTKLTMKEE